jgi:hypothetical protein
MQEIAFLGFKTFLGIIPLISNDKLRLINILFYFLCIFSFFYFKYKYS